MATRPLLQFCVVSGVFVVVVVVGVVFFFWGGSKLATGRDYLLPCFSVPAEKGTWVRLHSGQSQEQRYPVQPASAMLNYNFRRTWFSLLLGNKLE